MVQESVIADFQRKNLSLVSLSEPDLLIEDPSRIVMRQMLGAFYQYEKTLLVAKLRGARQRVKAQNARCEPRKPYGTRPGKDVVIERKRQLRHSGLAVDKIAESLNAEELKPRTAGSRWHQTSVYRILKMANAL